jgi:tryptophanyl-tRNA synthetase
MKKRLLTGLQSSGTLHIGNYFGALKPFLDIYEEYESFLMVADYHALTTLRDKNEMHENIINVVKDYLAVGIDPQKCVIFRQSDNQDHVELGWVFNCMVTVPFLMQAHAYKDKVAKGVEANAGLFTYPMLQAADIALYDTDVVPVGEDQRQHLEYSREAVGKFNRTFGEVLKEPKEMILSGVGVVSGTDGEKMSKSKGNIIPLFGTKEEITKAVMSIVTDSGKTMEDAIAESVATNQAVVRSIPFAKNLFSIHKLIKPDDEYNDLFDFYMANENNYKNLKMTLIEDLEAFIAPMREKREKITNEEVKEVLADGVRRAKAVSGETLGKVREAIGIAL